MHVDDLVAALALAATTDLPGVYNVAADGWLTADEARVLLPRSRMPAVPAEALERALRRTWRLGMGDVPPGVVPYLVHPWVLANDKLVAHGWKPQHRNEDAIREALASLPPRGRLRSRALAGVVVAFALVLARRRRQRVSAATKRSSSSSVL